MTFDWAPYRAVLLDLDGVITPTAEVHMAAWRTLFTGVLEGRPDQAPYTDQDYFDHVDGKPRYDGVRDFLASRGIELPEGGPDDGPDEETVHGLGNRKDQAFGEALRRDGVQPYPGSLRLLEALRDAGVALAVVSSSKNAPEVLRAAGVDHFFPVVVHGGVAAERGLRGKPAPDTYEAAADELGVEHTASVVVEDATSGVAAGAAGDFGLVVGVDRGAGRQALIDAGADLVVADLDELVPA